LKVSILEINIDRLSMEETLECIKQFVTSARSKRIVTANPEMIYASQFDSKLKNLLNSADLVTPDGEGIVWAARFLGSPVPQRVTGIDLLQKLLPIAANCGWRVFFLGGSPGVSAAAAEKVEQQYPGIKIDHYHGYFKPGKEEQQVLQKIKTFKPQLLFVGLGAPRQELWIAEHYIELSVPVSVGVGGSFDVLSGKVKRAPVLAQKLKLEWLARLISQPSRLQRQTVLPKFVAKVFLQKLKFTPKKTIS
jgi:N-acetylglucosaminyldiphosphoundecaprenol N-acetyl-beta-D-mannosaminyltransferase